ncbi:MAG: hypothetical protein ACYTEO_19990, partial [Planctomycetota bacterium]
TDVTMAWDDSTNSLSFQPNTDSTTSFQVKQADGTVFLNGDSTNGRVGVRVSDPACALEVFDVPASDPSILSTSIRNSIAVGGNLLGGIYVEGSSDAALFLDDSGAAANWRVMQLLNRDGRTRIRIRNDTGGTSLDNVLSINYNSSGNAGLGVGYAGDTGFLDVVRDDNTSFGTIARLRKRNPVPAVGDGCAFSMRVENDNNQDSNAGYYGGRLLDITDGAEQGEMVISPDFGDTQTVDLDGSFRVGKTSATACYVIMGGAAPYFTLHNSTHEDADGGRESRLNFKGEQSGGEETTLARIQAQHDGAADDQKGEIILSTNDGSDGDTPTERLRIDSAGTIAVPNAGFITLDKASGNGIKVDTTTPTFGWRDITGPIRKRGVGAWWQRKTMAVRC